MDLVGWTEHRTARRYAHVIDPMRREAMARIGGVLCPRTVEDPSAG
jgi:integrase